MEGIFKDCTTCLDAMILSHKLYIACKSIDVIKNKFKISTYSEMADIWKAYYTNKPTNTH